MRSRAMDLINFPYNLNFGKSQLTLARRFCFLPGDGKGKRS